MTVMVTYSIFIFFNNYNIIPKVTQNYLLNTMVYLCFQISNNKTIFYPSVSVSLRLFIYLFFFVEINVGYIFIILIAN